MQRIFLEENIKNWLEVAAILRRDKWWDGDTVFTELYTLYCYRASLSYSSEQKQILLKCVFSLKHCPWQQK